MTGEVIKYMMRSGLKIARLWSGERLSILWFWVKITHIKYIHIHTRYISGSKSLKGKTTKLIWGPSTSRMFMRCGSLNNVFVLGWIKANIELRSSNFIINWIQFVDESIDWCISLTGLPLAISRPSIHSLIISTKCFANKHFQGDKANKFRINCRATWLYTAPYLHLTLMLYSSLDTRCLLTRVTRLLYQPFSRIFHQQSNRRDARNSRPTTL